MLFPKFRDSKTVYLILIIVWPKVFFFKIMKIAIAISLSYLTITYECWDLKSLFLYNLFRKE
jgi:hypothetical protein